MIEQLKKNMFIGIGLMAMTKDRVKEFGKKLAEDSKLSEAEGEKFVDDLLKQADDMKNYFEKNFSEVVEKKIKNVKLPCTEGFEKMQKEINELKETLARIESKFNKKDARPKAGTVHNKPKK
ncbi:MAG TPA: hypothetical protein DET40_02830 [Lentisphaeria bacterium]|nr:MAG: hypothetical protein A2X45_14015 [Lentisphaerae bacterium GWF2_50_93]HCE42464.1 hypothetical protein [Lentisphaeria bacterium]